jgi:hypothetical protein
MAPRVATKRAVGTRHACASRRGATSSATSDRAIAAANKVNSARTITLR